MRNSKYNVDKLERLSNTFLSGSLRIITFKNNYYNENEMISIKTSRDYEFKICPTRSKVIKSLSMLEKKITHTIETHSES